MKTDTNTNHFFVFFFQLFVSEEKTTLWPLWDVHSKLSFSQRERTIEKRQETPPHRHRYTVFPVKLGLKGFVCASLPISVSHHYSLWWLFTMIKGEDEPRKLFENLLEQAFAAAPMPSQTHIYQKHCSAGTRSSHVQLIQTLPVLWSPWIP